MMMPSNRIASRKREPDEYCVTAQPRRIHFVRAEVTMVLTRSAAKKKNPASASATQKKSMSASSSGGGDSDGGGGFNPLLVLSYLTIVGLWIGSQYVLVPYVTHLLVLVAAILYAACHASLVLREEPDELSESQHSAASSERETLRKEDAYQFPIIGSISLFSLYLAFKYLDKDLVNMLIGAYFALVGCIALTMTVTPAVQRLLPAPFSKTFGWQYQLKHRLPEWVAGPSPWDLSQEFTGAELLSLVGSAAVCWLYVQNRTWYLNNVLGISFCLQGIERFSLGTYKIAAILLVGLFFYDIFWVFGTEVSKFEQYHHDIVSKQTKFLTCDSRHILCFSFLFFFFQQQW